MKILGMLFLHFRPSCLVSRWFSKIRENLPKFRFCKVVFLQNNSHSIVEMHVASGNMSYNCFNSSKSNSNVLKQSSIFFINVNKNAHYATLRMLIISWLLCQVNQGRQLQWYDKMLKHILSQISISQSNSQKLLVCLWNHWNWYLRWGSCWLE